MKFNVLKELIALYEDVNIKDLKIQVSPHINKLAFDEFTVDLQDIVDIDRVHVYDEGGRTVARLTLGSKIAVSKARDLQSKIQDAYNKFALKELSDLDGQDLIDRWIDQNKAYTFEGTRGVANFTKLVRDLGYDGIDEFFGDNSGACDKIIEFVIDFTDQNEEWKSVFIQYLDDGEVADDDLDGQTLVDAWMNANNAYSFEGPRGVKKLNDLTKDLKYRNLEDFMGDNPGSMESVIEFIVSFLKGTNEWLQSLINSLIGLNESQHEEYDGESDLAKWKSKNHVFGNTVGSSDLMDLLKDTGNRDIKRFLNYHTEVAADFFDAIVDDLKDGNEFPYVKNYLLDKVKVDDLPEEASTAEVIDQWLEENGGYGYRRIEKLLNDSGIYGGVTTYLMKSDVGVKFLFDEVAKLIKSGMLSIDNLE